MPFALRAMADFVIGRALADLRAVADLVIGRALADFGVAADLVIGRVLADFGVAASLARFAVARFLVAWIDPFALSAAADFAVGRALREVAFAVPAGLARRAVGFFFFI